MVSSYPRPRQLRCGGCTAGGCSVLSAAAGPRTTSPQCLHTGQGPASCSLLQPPDSCPHGRAPEDWRLLLGLGHEGDQPGRQGVPGRVRRLAPAQLWSLCSYQVIILQEPSSWWCSAAGPSPRARSPSASRATSSPSTGGGYLSTIVVRVSVTMLQMDDDVMT